jgi:hypothetical protein
VVTSKTDKSYLYKILEGEEIDINDVDEKWSCSGTHATQCNVEDHLKVYLFLLEHKREKYN